MEAIGERGELQLTRTTRPDGGEGYSYFRNGDVIVAQITPCFENGKGALARGLENGAALGTTELQVLRAGQGCDPAYLYYLTVSRAFRSLGAGEMLGAGGQKRIPESFVRNFRHPIPQLEEQRAIAAFLDRETARIDALVAKRERLLALLLERRAALVSRAVLRGLDDSVRLADSGKAWLGAVPVHWSVKRVKWVARMESGHTPDKKVADYWRDADIPWVSLADTGVLRTHDVISETAEYTNAAGIAHSSARVLPPRTVVFSRDATIGLCSITARPMAVSQHFIAWVCGDQILPEYLLQVFRCMQQELERLTMGATVRTIGMPDVRSLTVPLPPLPEQQEIVGFIAAHTAASDRLASKVEEAIAGLEEYRSALISAAVTGKIDVREGAA